MPPEPPTIPIYAFLTFSVNRNLCTISIFRILPVDRGPPATVRWFIHGRLQKWLANQCAVCILVT
jgi:hypothetical protein